MSEQDNLAEQQQKPDGASRLIEVEREVRADVDEMLRKEALLNGPEITNPSIGK